MPDTTQPVPVVSFVVIATRWDPTFRTLAALAREGGRRPSETIVVDDGSSDEMRLALPQLEGVRVVRNAAPHGRAAAANQGAALARGHLVAFLRGGVEPSAGWLEPLVRLAEADHDVAIVGSRLVTPSGLIAADGMALAYGQPFPLTPALVRSGERASPGDGVLEVPAVSGAAMLVRSEALRGLDGFDEDFWNGCEDIDLCLRAGDAGGKVLLSQASCAVVPLGLVEDRGPERNLALLNRRWLGRVTLYDPRGAQAAAPPPRPGRPPVTVVVPTSNAIRTIAPCVDQALRNLGQEDELVLADAGSEDGTREFERLLASEHRDSVRIVPCDPLGGVVGAARGGLAEASRPMAMLLHPTVAVPDGFLDELTRLLDENREYGVVALAAPPAGLCAVGPAHLLHDLAQHRADAFLQADPRALDAEVTARGNRLLFVPQP